MIRRDGLENPLDDLGMVQQQLVKVPISMHWFADSTFTPIIVSIVFFYNATLCFSNHLQDNVLVVTTTGYYFSFSVVVICYSADGRLCSQSYFTFNIQMDKMDK